MTRIGASQAFFNIVANFNAEKLITDTRSLQTVMKAVQLDTFEAILKPMQDFGMAIETGIKLTKDLAVELGHALVEFEKFFGEENLQATQRELIAIGQTYNQSISQALDAGSRSAQVANLVGKENVVLLTEQAMILSEISDLTVEEAQKGIIKLQQQTGVLYGGLNQAQYERLSLAQQDALLTERSAFALDALNTIANRSVALEGDLVQTMTNFAAQGKLAGDSFEFMAASAAVMLEAGEEAGTAGRALRMIYARLGGNINGTADKLEALGFQLKNENGEMKNMQDILAELDGRWGSFSGQQKQNIAQTIAGNRHYVRFIKLMENYTRATQLAEDGNAGLDSAVDQANRALEDQANRLEMAEKRVEFYQAALGREMGEFMIGATEMRGDYLDAAFEIQSAMGGIGKTIGRLYETMKVTGEFIKMGLAIRSMAIGMAMYDSVTRAVHQIEIANRVLHSKQETFFKFRESMTRNHQEALKLNQYYTQLMNHSTQEQNRAQRQINHIEKERGKNLQRQVELQGQLDSKLSAISTHSKFIANSQKASNAITEAGNDLYAKREAQNQYFIDQEIDRNALFMDFMNDNSATLRGYGSQMMANLEVARQLDSEQIKDLNTNHEKNRTIADGLQMLIAYNETARGITKTSQDNAELSMDYFKNNGDAYDMVLKELEARKDILDNTVKSNTASEEAKDLAEKQARSVGKLIMAMEEGEFRIGYGDDDRIKGDDANYLKDILKNMQGKYIATTKLHTLLNSKMFETIDLQERINTSTEVMNQLKGDGNANITKIREQLAQTYDVESEHYKKLEPLLQAVETAQQAGLDTSKEQQKLIDAIKSGQDVDLKNFEGYISSSEEMRSTTELANQQFGQMQFAMANSLSLLGGLAGGTTGATLSLAAMTTQLAMAGAELGKSASAMVKTQAKAWQLAMTMQGEGASGFKKFIAGAKAAKGALITLAATIAVTVFFARQRKEAEEFAKTLERISAVTDELNHSVASLGDQQATIFQGDGGLAELLGLDDISMKELSQNAELTDYYLDSLKNSTLDLDEEMGATFDKAVIDLKVLSAVLNDEVISDMEEFNDINKKIKDELKGGFFLGYQFNYSGKEKDATHEFLKDLIDAGKITEEEVGERLNWGENWEKLFTAGMAGAGTLKRTMKIVIDQLRDGNQLTQEQIDQLDDMGSGKYHDRVVDLISQMNDLVITGDEAALVMARFEEELNDIMDDAGGMADEVANLTDELYNFTNAREELFFGGKYGNVTGSLYKQVVTQGVGVLYNKQEVIVSNVFHGFFNEQEAGDRIGRIVEEKLQQINGI